MITTCFRLVANGQSCWWLDLWWMTGPMLVTRLMIKLVNNIVHHVVVNISHRHRTGGPAALYLPRSWSLWGTSSCGYRQNMSPSLSTITCVGKPRLTMLIWSMCLRWSTTGTLQIKIAMGNRPGKIAIWRPFEKTGTSPLEEPQQGHENQGLRDLPAKWLIAP